MKTVSLEERIQNIESDLQYLRGKMEDIHETLRLALQEHSEERIMSAKEVADFLKMDLNLLYVKCSRGEMSCFKTGKLIKFKKTEILKWMRKQDSQATGSIDDIVNRYLQKKVLRG
jgi:excisionase family DNA binding protein